MYYDIQKAHMQPIFTEGVKERLERLSLVRVELGCGPNRKFNDSVTIDQLNHDDVDIVTDLNLGIPLDDETVDEIHSSHFLEHVVDFGEFMRETYRVLKPRGIAVHVVPHFAHPYFYSDYTHKTFFGLYTFHYFSRTCAPFKRRVPTFYNDIDFTVKSVRLGFKSPFRWRNRLRKCVEAIVNLGSWMQEFHEENLGRVFPAYEIRVVLVKPE